MKPVISIVEPDDALSTDIRRRFGSDYDLDVASDEQTGLAHLRASGGAGAQVALIIVPSWMGGVDYLVRSRELHAKAKRLLMIRVGDVGARSDIRRALTLNQIDFFFGSPWASPEEELYPIVSEALRLWGTEHLPRYDKATIIDRGPAHRAREIQAYLEPNLVWTSPGSLTILLATLTTVGSVSINAVSRARRASRRSKWEPGHMFRASEDS